MHPYSRMGGIGNPGIQESRHSLTGSCVPGCFSGCSQCVLSSEGSTGGGAASALHLLTGGRILLLGDSVLTGGWPRPCYLRPNVFIRFTSPLPTLSTSSALCFDPSFGTLLSLKKTFIIISINLPMSTEFKSLPLEGY